MLGSVVCAGEEIYGSREWGRIGDGQRSWNETEEGIARDAIGERDGKQLAGGIVRGTWVSEFFAAHWD